MKICIVVPEDSRFKTAKDLLEVDRNILQYQGASFVKDEQGFPVQNQDGSWTILVETDWIDPITTALERSYNLKVSLKV